MGKTQKKITFNTICNIISFIFVVIVIALAIYGIRVGIFTDLTVLEEQVKKAGVLGPLAFIIIQIIQVVIPIIPGGVTLPAGVLLFGPVWGFIYNYTSICAGSFINFIMIKHYGPRLLKKFASESLYNKYLGWLEKEDKFEKLFALAIFLPMFPDDFLCRLAGITKMTIKKFLLIILLCKPITIVCYSFAVNGIVDKFFS